MEMLIAILAYLVIALAALAAQAAVAELALARAAATDGLEKLANDNPYWRELVPAGGQTKRELLGQNGLFHFTGGQAVGLAETLLIYTLLCAFPDTAGIAVVGYLAFKMAGKWAVWSHVYRVGDSASSIRHTAEQRDWPIFRSRLGQVLFTRLIVGTIISLLIAVVASMVFHAVS